MSDKNTLARNSILAGSFAGVTNTLIFHPFDVIRTRMQSSTLNSNTKQKSSSKNYTTSTESIFSPVSRAIKIQIEKGGGKVMRSLYTGLSLPLCAQTVYKATVFTTNEITRNYFLEYNRGDMMNRNTSSRILNTSETFICGFIGGAVNAFFFVSPVEFVRNQQIHHQHAPSASISSSNNTNPRLNYTGPLNVIRRTLEINGISGLWKGTCVTVARDSIGCGLFFVALDHTKRTLSSFYTASSVSNSSLSPSDQKKISMISGAMAGIAFWLGALPLDTLKTLVQTNQAPNMQSALYELIQIEKKKVFMLESPVLSASSLSVAKLSLLTKNVCVKLFKGWQMAFGKGIPGAAVTILSYDFVVSSLKKYE